MSMRVILSLLLFGFWDVYVGIVALSKDGGLALTPPMGWNSWNVYVCDDLSEERIRSTALQIKQTGLASAGYRYVNIDDCWQLSRNSTGHIEPDLTRFPNGSSGMRDLGEYLHGLDLKFGIYTDLGSMTCQRRPGSHRHEALDAAVYASWGVDYLKNDDCYIHPSTPIVDAYRTMYQALQETNRPIIHSIKGSISLHQADGVSHMRRVGVDIGDDWALVMHLVDEYNDQELWKYSHPAFWNDLDMLEIGNAGLNHDENVAHFALWCAFKAPLLLGNDLHTMSNDTLELLKHPGLIAINQDSLGEAVRWVKSEWSTADGGMSMVRAVSLNCSHEEANTHWRYVLTTQHLVHVQSEQCLYRDADEYLSVQSCAEDEAAQRWVLDKEQGQIHPNNAATWCLTLSRELYGEAKVRPCDERPKHLDWQGSLKEYMGIQESFQYHNISSDTFMFENKNQGCLAIGGKEELIYYIGHLSEERYVLLVVNRDTVEHDVFLDYAVFKELSEKNSYDVIDVLTGEPVATKEGGFNFALKGHYVLVVILS